MKLPTTKIFPNLRGGLDNAEYGDDFIKNSIALQWCAKKCPYAKKKNPMQKMSLAKLSKLFNKKF